MRLGSWINPRHVGAEAVARARAAFDADRFSSLVLDDFLQPTRISGLRACFGGDAAFRDHYGLIDRYDETGSTFAERAVGAEVFASSAETDRLAREQVLSGPAPGRALSPGWGTYLRWLMLLRSEEFREYLRGITGTERLTDIDHMPRIMRRGDFCRPHDDTGRGRRLCMLLYIDDGWRPGFGGRFQQIVDGTVAYNVEPVGNRVLLHRPAVDLIHQVEAFSAKARDWNRWTHSIWFLG